MTFLEGREREVPTITAFLRAEHRGMEEGREYGGGRGEEPLYSTIHT